MKTEKTKKPGACSEGPGVADTEQMTHHNSKIVSCNRDQVTFANIGQTAEPCWTSSAGLADVSEAKLDYFTATRLQFSALGTLYSLPSALRHHELMTFRFDC